MGQDKFLKKALIVGPTGIVIALFAIFLVIYANQESLTGKGLKIREISINRAIIKAEIVDTDVLRTRGLSGRDGLKDDSGMLFVFGREDYHGIWMKEMNFPIDIIWFDKNLKIVSAKENVLPESYPEVFKPFSPALYVLEVPVDFMKKHKIEIGMAAKIVSSEAEKD